MAEAELGDILAHYAALIAAARHSLPARDAIALIRRLLDEQTLALRAAKDRHCKARENQKQIHQTSPSAPSGFPKQQLG